VIVWAALAALGIAAAVWVGTWLGGARARAALRDDLDALQAELARRVEEVFSLQELSFVLSESLQPTRIAERITGYVERFMHVGGAVVALTAEDGHTLRVAAAVGALRSLKGRVIDETDRGSLIQAIGREQLEVVERAGDVAPVLAAGLSVERAATVPLRAHGVTVGAVAVANRVGGPFTPSDLRLLSTVATHAAIVLSNARFFDLVRTGRDQWETTFNALSEGLAVVDETGVIQRANQSLARTAGASTTALIGRPFTDVLFIGDDDMAAFLQAARASEPDASLTRGAEAGNRTFRVTAAPMHDDRGGAPWTALLVEDVTERQAIESQLIQSEKMAAVGQLVSGVAHELNNPLTSIAGLAEFLLTQPTPTEKDRGHLKVIHEQADRAGRIVRNLLTFARQGPTDVGELDLNDIVQRTVALVHYELQLREVRLDTTYDPSLPVIHGDRYQIQQVVLNLMTNAVQAVEHNDEARPRHITISTAVEGDMAVLRVADSGPGIAPEQLREIFTPFYTTKAPGKGTGLGLAISYRIVHGHGGTMWAERAPDGGAILAVQLPLHHRPSAAPRAVPAGSGAGAEPDATAPTGTARTRTILLVDDDQAVRRMISALLANDVQAIVAAHDAPHAIQLLEQRRFDLIIADPRSAVSAGERFADHLLRRWPDVRDRTILVTADVRPETRAWLQRLGCRYFLKPFRVGELKAATAEVLGVARR